MIRNEPASSGVPWARTLVPWSQSAALPNSARLANHFPLLTNRQTTRRSNIYAFRADSRQSGEYRKNKAGIAPTETGEREEKKGLEAVGKRREFLSAGAGRNFDFLLDQLAQNGRNLVKIGGFIKKQIGSGRQTFLPIFGIGKVRANQNKEVRVCRANGAQNIEAAAAGHVQIEDQRIRPHLLDAVYGAKYVARLADKLGAGDFFEKARQTFYDYPGVISDKDFHSHFLHEQHSPKRGAQGFNPITLPNNRE
jgi:hypothetical protein